MRILSKLLVLGAALTLSTSLAFADPVSPFGTGGISFEGQNILTSNSLEFFGTQTDPIASGSLSAYENGHVSFPENLNGFSNLPTGTFFTINNGVDTLEYYLTSAVYSSSFDTTTQQQNQVLSGLGYFTATADVGGALVDSSTDGTFTLTTQDGYTTFSANSAITSVAATPEPGSLLLLGTGLLSAAGIARRKFASKLS